MPDVDIDLIRPSPYQPRLFFEVDDLKEEIQRDGLLSALVVRKKDEYYELIDGERRLRVLKNLGWKQVPIVEREVDNRTARRSVFKVNKIRENYTTEEEARYFKKLFDEGMKPYQIETELGVKHSWVQACLNVFLFPKEIRDHIFLPGRAKRFFYISDIYDLEGVINRNPDEAIEIARQIINERLSQAEKDKLITGRVAVIDEERLKAAEEAVAKITPEAAKLETPEDLEKASEALKKEAERRKTPEQIAEEEREKLVAEARKSLDSTARKIDRASQVMDVSEFRERLTKLEETLEADPGEAKAQLSALGEEVTEAESKAKAEAKAKQEEEKRQQKAEEEQRREERADKKAREKYKGDKEFVREALRAMPEEEVAEMLNMVPIPGKVKKVKSPEQEFDDVMKMASKVVDSLEKLKREEKIEQIDLKRFSITLRILADCLDEFAKLAEGSL